MTATSSPNQLNCGHADVNPLEPALLASLGLSFPESYFSGKDMAGLASAISARRGWPMAMLPFCSTVEAEALGADIFLGGNQTGPRYGKLVHSSVDEYLALGREFDPGTPRVGALLEAVGILAAEGLPPVVEISGPLGILASFVDLGGIVKAWRKNPETVARAFRLVGRRVLGYALALRDAGARMLSYADPAGAPGIVGPKFSQFLAESFLGGFLPGLGEALGGLTVHLCPHTSATLVSAGLGEFRRVEAPPDLNYPSACLALRGRVKFLGKGCLKNVSLPGRVMEEFKFHDTGKK
ncbi:MAG: hypothetical protein LBO05_06700 [Deltaproteobacteria bacterium]|jgi:hypothetical protein|nr:hypothetical protein [Deltaproteobacteria bacterium]